MYPGLSTALVLKPDAFLEMHKGISNWKFTVVSIQTKGFGFNGKETEECVFAARTNCCFR